MAPIKNKKLLLLLPFALCGFALAQPVYHLLLQTPVFLLARQNTRFDIWALVFGLSLVLPLLLALPGYLGYRRWPVFSSLWCWVLSSCFAALFVGQLLQSSIATHEWIYMALAVGVGAAIAWIMLFSKWAMLGSLLALIATLFPIWFLLFSPVLEKVDDYATISQPRDRADQPLPHVVFILLDELPMATLVDGQGQIDKELFPGFARLQSMSDWYANTTSVSDGTGAAVPAILTGRYPDEKGSGLTVAEQPINLFTMLRRHYSYNVAEAVTRFCPQALCPVVGPDHYRRFKALLLDLSAIYLHRVVPDRWSSELPSVTNNWSGFFAERQVFFPEGWVKHAGAQTEIDRPAYFNQFTQSIKDGDEPILNFMHILFPHEPNAYLANGENYGLAWMRGQVNETWGDVEWGIINGKQRHYVQVQYADLLLNRLLDHLQTLALLNDAMIVVVTDHGIGFSLNDNRRALSDLNQAALLRVPLFIKNPQQQTGRRIDRPVMTIDILPTVLATLGFSIDSLGFDGIDLRSSQIDQPRTRRASSHLDPVLRELDETDLDISDLVAENRRQLKLDDPDTALWEIGPFDKLRGQHMDVVCEKAPADIKVFFGKFSPLPNTRPETTVRAFIKGTFTGPAAVQESRPFLVTNDELIVASGYTWVMKEYPKFFALVEPKYIKQENWKPEVWLLNDRQCFGNRH